MRIYLIWLGCKVQDNGFIGRSVRPIGMFLLVLKNKVFLLLIACGIYAYVCTGEVYERVTLTMLCTANMAAISRER